jgi:uncharacterized membrane protein
MKTENKVLMQKARESLAGKWGTAVAVAFIYLAIIVALGSIHKIGGVFSLLVTGPLVLGLAIFSLALSRGKEIKVVQVFEGWSRFGTALAAYLLMILFTLLWVLLLIVPGIIANISYSQMFFILVDDTTVSPREAMKKSKQMMYGNKWKYFCLQLRFIGWTLLSLLTLGIGFLWLVPYMEVSQAKFYDDLKGSTGNLAQI